MSEEQKEISHLEINNPPISPDKPPRRAKRDIFRFNGERPTAINLEHVTHMCLEGKKITFHFYSTAIFFDFENDEVAASAFEVILNNWCADVVA